MRNKSNTKFVVGAVAAIALTAAIWSPLISQPADPTPMKMGNGKTMMDGKMMEGCQAIMDQKKQMVEDMTSQDAELTAHVAKMNAAPVGEKVAVMAAVVTQMVEQQVAMHARTAKKDEMMMKHMMQHMQKGKESMSECPMMKGMGKMEGMDGMDGMKRK